DPGEPLERLHAAVLAHDPVLDWNGARQDAADSDRVGAAVMYSGSPGVRPADSGAGPGWGRRRARRLLAPGSAVAVAAAVSIVVVARPWAGEAPAQLPGNSVGLIASAGGRVGQPVSVGSPDGLAYGDGSVWAVDTTEGTLSRINPATHA